MAESAREAKGGEAAPQARPGGGPLLGARRRWIASALALFTAATVYALRQAPRPDPTREPTAWEWLRHPVEENAFARLAALPGGVSSIALLDERRAWIVSGGRLFYTDDRGARWNAPDVEGFGGFEAVAFNKKGDGAACGHSEVFSTSDGGVTWKRENAAAEASFQAIAVRPSGKWVAVGDAGFVVEQTEKGIQAFTIDANTKQQLLAVQFVDEEHGFATGGYNGSIYRKLPGRAWQHVFSASVPWFRGLAFVDEKHGWVAGAGGTVLETRDAGATWTKVDTRTTRDLYAIAALDEKRVAFGVPSGDAQQLDGSVHALAAADGERWLGTDTGMLYRWDEQLVPLARRADVEGGGFVDERRGAQFGSHLRFRLTDDGGATWRAASRAEVLKLFPNLERPASAETKLPRTDFEAATLDPLGGTRWLAIDKYGITRSSDDDGASWTTVTKHRRYPAPWYWIAVVASIALLGPALRKPRAVEAERSIADIAISDKPLTPESADPLDFGEIARGLCRFLRNEHTEPPLTVAVTGEWGTGKSSIMNLTLADLREHGHRAVWFNAWHHQREEQLLASLLETIRDDGVPPWLSLDGLAFRWRLVALRMRKLWLPTVALVAIVLALFAAGIETPEAVKGWFDRIRPYVPFAPVLAALAGLWAMLEPFGGKRLWRRVRRALRIDARVGDVGYRIRFARQLEDVTRALAPARLVIFIDDLDRCRPENVLTILEAVNFLVSSGDCIVVLGMARERVQRCIGIGFAEVAEELVDGGDARAKRAEFARLYLEKLVNIEVPVPARPPADTARIVADDREPPPSHRGRRLAALARIASAALVLAGAVWIGSSLRSPALPSPLTNAPAPPPAPAPEKSPAAQTSAPSPPPVEPARASSAWLPADAGGGARWPLLFALLPLLAIAAVALSRRADQIVRDSPEFLAALRFWHPLAMLQRNTPRAVKRFANRVRFFAMRQRRTPPRPSLWQRITRNVPPPPLSPDAIPDEILVALAALHNANLLDSTLDERLAKVGDNLAMAARLKDWAGDRAFLQYRVRFDDLVKGVEAF